jgi:hypothetical protein
MRLFLPLLSLMLIVSTSQASSSLILEGNSTDGQFISINRENDLFQFKLCEVQGECKILGKESYSLCEMKEYVKEPLWTIFLGGEVSFSLASLSWGGFVKSLIWRSQESDRKIRVTDLMFKEQAVKTRVSVEAEKIEKTLALIGDQCSKIE